MRELERESNRPKVTLKDLLNMGEIKRIPYDNSVQKKMDIEAERMEIKKWRDKNPKARRGRGKGH